MCFLICLFTILYPIVHHDQMNGHSELVIDRVSKDDSGTYTCVAENRVGTIKSLGFVYVKGEVWLPWKHCAVCNASKESAFFSFLASHMYLGANPGSASQIKGSV